MILPDDPTGIEDAAKSIGDVASAAPICVTDQIAALAQALGFVYEFARVNGIGHAVSEEELKELVDRYMRRGAIIEQAINQMEIRLHGN